MASNNIPKRELNLLERVEQASSKAMEEGWRLTKEAMSSHSNPKLQQKLIAEAETAYKSPLHKISQGYLIDCSDMTTQQLALEVIGVNINVFDLYRRVGRLDEAIELGEKTLEDAISFKNTSMILRAGNFLTLTQSAQAYESISKNDLEGALAKYREIEKSFDSMHLENAEGKNAVMLYVNLSANYLNIVDISELQGHSISALEEELNKAEEASKKAESFVNGLENHQDKATWIGSIYSILGDVAKYRGDFESAINNYNIALKASNEGANYDLQTAVLETKIAYALISQPKPDIQGARQHFEIVNSFLENHDFGIYQPLILPIVQKIEKSL